MRRSKNPTRQLSQIVVIGALISAIALAPTRPASANAGESSWTYTGSLNTARSGHRATLLPNGKVLVVGGYSNTTYLTSAELYDPTCGTWSFTSDLNTPRSYHTATLLPDGKVLVVGGGYHRTGDDFHALNTAELYDPGTGKWSVTGTLNTPRAGHTATLLQNGKVLVAGFNTAELYDPATGLWSFTGNPNTHLYAHTATLLQNGTVLAAGGNRAVLYDPDKATWSSIGRLDGSYRFHHTATLLPDGGALIAGGHNDDDFNFAVYLTTELYNPNTGKWSGTGLLNSSRLEHTVALLPDGKILVAGGSYSDPSVNSELYDPATGKWNTTAGLNTARSAHTATLLTNGKALIAGGFDGNLALRSAELYSGTGSGTVTVSAASYYLTGLSSDSTATSFGTDLATASIAANTSPLPTEIAGTTVKVKDSAREERLAPLLYVSPTQVNYLIPVGTALGAATVAITSGSGSVSSGVVLIKPVAPSLFAANGDGQGVAAAFALRVKADGSQSYEEVVQFDNVQNRFIARPIDLGPEGEQVYLVFFGTGIRSRSTLSAVIATIGGVYSAVSFAGAQLEFAGVDQVNVLVPRSLIGRGEVDVLLTVEAQMANPVRIHVK